MLEIADLRVAGCDARRSGVARASDEALDLVVIRRAPVGTKVVAALRFRSERIRGQTALCGVIRLSTQPLGVVGLDDMARRACRKDTAGGHCHHRQRREYREMAGDRGGGGFAHGQYIY